MTIKDHADNVPTKGSIEAMVWAPESPELFHSTRTQIFHNIKSQTYSISSFGMEDVRMGIVFFLDEGIKEGEFDISSEDGNVSAIYNHVFPNHGWSYHAVSGKLNITKIDLPNKLIVATFDFKAPAKEQGQPMVDVKNGKIDITGPN